MHQTNFSKKNYYFPLNGLGCSGLEWRLQECADWNVNVTTRKICSHGIAVVSCKLSTEKIVRLTNITADGDNVEGEVEIFKDGIWMPLCSRGWFLTQSNVICKTIGFSKGAAGYKSNVLFNQPKRRNYYYLLNGLSCLGKENTVQDCYYWNTNVPKIQSCAYGIAIAICKR